MKVRRGTKNVEKAIRRRQENELFALPQQEFTNRARLVDTNGTSYALPRAGDALYDHLVSRGEVEPVEANGLPSEKRKIKTRTAEGIYLGRTLLYARKKRTAELSPYPRGSIQIKDTETQTLYTGVIIRSIFRRQSKSGYVIVDKFTDFGTLSDSSAFSGRT